MPDNLSELPAYMLREIQQHLSPDDQLRMRLLNTDIRAALPFTADQRDHLTNRFFQQLVINRNGESIDFAMPYGLLKKRSAEIKEVLANIQAADDANRQSLVDLLFTRLMDIVSAYGSIGLDGVLIMMRRVNLEPSVHQLNALRKKSAKCAIM